MVCKIGREQRIGEVVGVAGQFPEHIGGANERAFVIGKYFARDATADPLVVVDRAIGSKQRAPFPGINRLRLCQTGFVPANLA